MKKITALILALGIFLMPQSVSAAEGAMSGGGATVVSYQANKETYIEAPRTGNSEGLPARYLFEFSLSGFVMFILLYIRNKDKEELVEVPAE